MYSFAIMNGRRVLTRILKCLQSKRNTTGRCLIKFHHTSQITHWFYFEPLHMTVNYFKCRMLKWADKVMFSELSESSSVISDGFFGKICTGLWQSLKSMGTSFRDDFKVEWWTYILTLPPNKKPRQRQDFSIYLKNCQMYRWWCLL